MWSAYLGMTQMCLFYFAIWVNWPDLQCKGQVGRWDGSVLDINAIRVSVPILDRNAHSYYVCTQLLWYNVLPLWQSKCHCAEYYVIRNLPMFSYHRWHWYHSNIVGECSNALIPLVHYSQPPVTSMESTCYIYIHKKEEKYKVMALSPTFANTLGSSSNHVVESSRLWRYCRWVKSYHKLWVVVSIIAEGDPAPPELLDLIQWKRSTEACGCH